MKYIRLVLTEASRKFAHASGDDIQSPPSCLSSCVLPGPAAVSSTTGACPEPSQVRDAANACWRQRDVDSWKQAASSGRL